MIVHKCESKFGGSKCNSNQKWNSDKRICEYKNYETCNESWNTSRCICQIVSI